MKTGNLIIGNVIFEVRAVDGKTAFIQIVDVSGETNVRLRGRTFQVPLWHNLATVGVDKTSKRFECFEYRLQDTQVVLEKGDRLNALINYSGDGQLFFILAVAEEHHMLVADNFVQQWKASRDETRGCKVERGKTTESRLSANDGFVSLEEALRAAEEEKLPLTPSQQRMMKDHQHRDRSSKKQGTLASAA